MPDAPPNSGTQSATPPATPTPAVARWRKFLRRALLVGVGLFILLLAIFFLLPVWISNEQGRLYVLDRLNDRLHGPRVAVDEWTLGWFRTTELKNLRILAPDGATILSCPHVSSGLTLWDVFWSNYDIRNTTADKLELNISKNTDGTTSLDSFAMQEGGAGDILRSARGALQITNGQITIYSAKTGQTVRYTDAKATVSIASPDAPFHLEIKAIGAPGESLSLLGSFPPTSTLSAKSLGRPEIWTLAGDLEFAATQLPTGLACDYLNVDSAWVDSFGPSLEAIQFSGHAPPLPTAPSNHSDTMHLTLMVNPKPRTSDTATIEASLMLHIPAPGATGSGGMLAVTSPDVINIALRQSPPLARLLGRINPLLGEISPTPAGLVRGSVTNLGLPLDHPEKADASLRLTFPQLLFATRDGPSLLRQLQVSFGEIPRPNARIEGTAEALRARLADGQFSYENFLVTLATGSAARRINFTGNVALDGKVDLFALIPVANSGLGMSTSRVVITGTTDTPLLKRAE